MQKQILLSLRMTSARRATREPHLSNQGHYALQWISEKSGLDHLTSILRWSIYSVLRDPQHLENNPIIVDLM
jgi:hypothetical protein